MHGGRADGAPVRNGLALNRYKHLGRGTGSQRGIECGAVCHTATLSGLGPTLCVVVALVVEDDDEDDGRKPF